MSEFVRIKSDQKH